MFIPHIGFLIFIIAFYKLSPLFEVISRTLKVKKQKLLIVLLTVFFFVFCIGIINFIKLSNYQKAIESKELLVVKGCIESYQSTMKNSREESIEIDKIKFKWNHYATSKYFFANRKYGDNFIKNNQCINVYYIPENLQNHIVKIEHN